jgi:hypothetical protein
MFELSAATRFGGAMWCLGIFDGELRTCVGDWSSSGRSETTSSAAMLSLASSGADAGFAWFMNKRRGNEEVVTRRTTTPGWMQLAQWQGDARRRVV